MRNPVRLWSRGASGVEPFVVGDEPLPSKGPSADVPVERLGGIPEPWLGTNYYARELITRLFAVADAARNYYDVGRPEGIAELEARATLRNALRRLDGDE